LTFDLDLRTLARFLYRYSVPNKFDRPTFSGWEVIVRTNKHTDKHTDKETDAAENIHLASLRYTGG